MSSWRRSTLSSFRIQAMNKTYSISYSKLTWLKSQRMFRKLDILQVTAIKEGLFYDSLRIFEKEIFERRSHNSWHGRDRTRRKPVFDVCNREYAHGCPETDLRTQVSFRPNQWLNYTFVDQSSGVRVHCLFRHLFFLEFFSFQFLYIFNMFMTSVLTIIIDNKKAPYFYFQFFYVPDPVYLCFDTYC